MALSERQTQALLKMFIKNIVHEESKEEREKLYVEFEDSFKGIFLKWEDTIYSALVDNSVPTYIITEWQQFKNKTASRRERDDIAICDMKLEDERAIVRIIVDEIGCVPYFSEFNETGTVKEFKDTGYSFVAKKGEEIVGVMMAQKQMSYGSNYIFIENFAVVSSFQGMGVGRLLMHHLFKLARKEKIHRINLNTQKKLKAYDIYHHMGFEDQSDGSIFMTKWII